MPESQAAHPQQDIDSILKEARKFPPPAEYSRGSHLKSMAEYQKIYDEAAADPEKFWAGIARELHWFQPWNKVLEWDLPWAKWFIGGKITCPTTVLTVMCRDRARTKPR
jgi:Domain of unknown function (DUF3448).